MTIAASTSPQELALQVNRGFVDEYFEALLLDADGLRYDPQTTNPAAFLLNEVAAGYGGYRRQLIQYTSADVGAYTDDGVALATKAAVFEHDGNNSQEISFSHVVLKRATGNVLALSAVTSEPVNNAVEGVYPDMPVSGGSGTGAVCQLTITGTVHTVSVTSPGYGYLDGDSVRINGADLQAAGANLNSDADVLFSVQSTYESGEEIVAVAAPDATTVLTAGNQAVFYFDLKHYGFYNV